MIAELIGGPCDGWRREIPDDSTECHAIRQGDAPPGQCETGTYMRVVAAVVDGRVRFMWLGWDSE